MQRYKYLSKKNTRSKTLLEAAVWQGKGIKKPPISQGQIPKVSIRFTTYVRYTDVR